jgi:hypothetical protein
MTIIAGTQKIFLELFEAAGCDVPHLGAYLAHWVGTTANQQRDHPTVPIGEGQEAALGLVGDRQGQSCPG